MGWRRFDVGAMSDEVGNQRGTCPGVRAIYDGAYYYLEIYYSIQALANNLSQLIRHIFIADNRSIVIFYAGRYCVRNCSVYYIDCGNSWEFCSAHLVNDVRTDDQDRWLVKLSKDVCEVGGVFIDGV